MEKRVTLLIQGRARSQLIKRRGEPAYFTSLYVNPAHRRIGYGLELMKFAIAHLNEFPDMDILYHSKTCQRNAMRLGYRKTGRQSDRFQRCALWNYYGPLDRKFVSRLRILKTVKYRRKDGDTEVIYLSKLLVSQRPKIQ